MGSTSEPGLELELKDVKELMIKKAFQSSLREIQDLVVSFEDMADMFKGIEKDSNKKRIKTILFLLKFCLFPLLTSRPPHRCVRPPLCR